MNKGIDDTLVYVGKYDDQGTPDAIGKAELFASKTPFPAQASPDRLLRSEVSRRASILSCRYTSDEEEREAGQNYLLAERQVGRIQDLSDSDLEDGLDQRVLCRKDWLFVGKEALASSCGAEQSRA